MPESTSSFGGSEASRRVMFRRLLLAKQLYLHGFDHSNRAGALDKMIAVHNFHNAIEIVLRAIMLHYEIRPDKELNITFEVMLNDIYKFPAFKDQNKRLPYRQQLVMLNEERNHVQHHAIEPESSTMEEWRVFTRRFLGQALDIFFELDFNNLSALDMVANDTLRVVLRESLSAIEENKLEKSVVLSKAAFDMMASALWAFLPSQEIEIAVRTARRLQESRELEEMFGVLLEELHGGQYFASLLWSGISLLDLQKFRSCTQGVNINYSESGKAEVLLAHELPEDTESVRWLHDFVVSTIVHWQTLGFPPSISESDEGALRKLLEIY
jgi:hypothetical protein